MKDMFKNLIIVFAFLFSTSVFADAQLGRDYTLLDPAQPVSTKKIEVIEFFFYECPHCFHLHNEMMGWEKTMPRDVALTFIPTIFRDSTEPLARTFYALQGIGKIKQLDDAIYQAIHVQNVELYDLDSISAFVGKHGVDTATFKAAYNSFTVNSRVMRAKQLIRRYGINGTPTLIVDGKYVITGLEPIDALRVLDEIIIKVRKAHHAKHKSK